MVPGVKIENKRSGDGPERLFTLGAYWQCQLGGIGSDSLSQSKGKRRTRSTLTSVIHTPYTVTGTLNPNQAMIGSLEMFSQKQIKCLTLTA